MAKNFVVLFCPPAAVHDAAALRADIAQVDPGLAARLPEGASPVAALGAACRSVRTPRGVTYTLGHRGSGGSTWIRCDSTRDSTRVEIAGDLPVTAEPTGALDVSPWIPRDEADAIRAAYAHHRTAMTPAQVSSAVAGEMARRAAVSATRAGSAWLVSGDHADGLDELGEVLARHGATLAIHALAGADEEKYRPTAAEALREEIDRVLRDAETAREKWRAEDRKRGPRAGSEGTQLAALSEAAAKIRIWRDGLKIDVAALDQALAASADAVREAFREASGGSGSGGGSGGSGGDTGGGYALAAAAPSLDW